MLAGANFALGIQSRPVRGRSAATRMQGLHFTAMVYVSASRLASTHMRDPPTHTSHTLCGDYCGVCCNATDSPETCVSLRMHAPGPVARAVGTGAFLCPPLWRLTLTNQGTHTQNDLGAVEREHNSL